MCWLKIKIHYEKRISIKKLGQEKPVKEFAECGGL
jgi:hypothetical protein